MDVEKKERREEAVNVWYNYIYGYLIFTYPYNERQDNALQDLDYIKSSLML